jgi:hypothetical protein
MYTKETYKDYSTEVVYVWVDLMYCVNVINNYNCIVMLAMNSSAVYDDVKKDMKDEWWMLFESV